MILDNIMDFVLHKGYYIRVYDFVQNSLLIRCGNKLFPKFSYETFSYSAKKKNKNKEKSKNSSHRILSNSLNAKSLKLPPTN